MLSQSVPDYDFDMVVVGHAWASAQAPWLGKQQQSPIRMYLHLRAQTPLHRQFTRRSECSAWATSGCYSAVKTETCLPLVHLVDVTPDARVPNVIIIASVGTGGN